MERLLESTPFGDPNAQGLNFAVAASELRYFLQNQPDGLEALNTTCNEPKLVFEGRNQDNNAFIRVISLRCDDTADIIFVVPDDKREPIFALVDLKRRGKPDGIIFDRRRSGKWDVSILG